MLRLVKLSNDKIFTPQWVVEDMIKYFSPQGKVLDPCRGDGAFTNVISNALWCEIDEGVDFFNWSDKVDWIISNPPFSKLRKFILHSFKVSDNIVFLVPVWKVFMAYGLIKEADKFGGIKEIRWYGTGTTLGFPMGNGIGAVYWKRNYKGSSSQTFYEASEVE